MRVVRNTLCAVVAGLLSPLAAAEAVPRAPFNSEKAPGGPMPAARVAAEMALPPGFRCTVFAAEPDVAQPIAMASDARGRLWVAENYTYAERPVGFSEALRDRILIFDDHDNDGRFDRRTVFFDRAQRLTSLEIGAGGVWALCPPQLLFIPDRNQDDVADGEPEVVLDGFDALKAQHNIANGLRWGPDGWLYGRQGILGHSLIGAPGTLAENRVPLNVGIWRFHPRTRVFEVVAAGTTNPWGMDWDAHGEAFFINTVIGHLWHLIPGAHYRRMFGDDPTPNVYEVIEQHADHVHWASGETWTDVRKGVSAATAAQGGGHAHTGLLVYQGGQWPAAWQGRVLTINFHGRRINVERLERDGSGFVGRHEPDAFFFPDPWFRGIDLLAAPDGGVYVSDWSDTGECHDLDGVHRTSGRIYKLCYGEPAARDGFDLTSRSAVELARLQRSANDWLARQSRRVLADRAAAGAVLDDAHRELERMAAPGNDTVHRLRALWALRVSGAPLHRVLRDGLEDRDEAVRAWAVRLITDERPLALAADDLDRLVRLAKNDSSARVRLVLASAVSRLPFPQRIRLAAPLLAHREDANDHNLPKLLWYGLSGLAEARDPGFVRLIAGAQIPLVQRFGARQLAEDIDASPDPVDALLRAVAGQGSREAGVAVLDGIAEALAGRRTAPAPASWTSLRATFTAMADDRLTRRLRELDALFGDGRALEELRGLALDATADGRQRRDALQALIDARVERLRELCEQLLPVNGLAATAASGLALDADPAIAGKLLAAWPRFDATEKPRIMSVLVSRPAWAGQVLDAMAQGRIPRASLTAFHARQIRAYHDNALTERLKTVWGEVPDESEKGRLAAMEQWQTRFTPAILAKADREKGRGVFRALCAPCHTLNGEGGQLGPDLSGAARDNLNYLLENVLFPSALVADEYRLTTLTLKDGRVLAGMIRSRSARTLRLQTMTDLITVATEDLLKEAPQAASLMPPGLIEAVPADDARDLIAYLMTK